MINLLDKFVYINMNSRDKNVGDCVCRSLSLAFDMDYNKARAELNKLKRDSGSSSYKNKSVYSQFIDIHEGSHVNPKVPTDKTTVQELSEKESGTLIVLCKDPDPKKRDTHLVTIINGNIYDTWNSGDWIVDRYWKVSGHDKADPDMDIREYIPYVEQSFKYYLDKYNKKFDLDGDIRNSLKINFRSGFEIIARATYLVSFKDEIHQNSKGYNFEIPYKLRPTSSEEDNKKIIDNTSLSWIRWYLKGINKDRSDYLEYADLHDQYDDKFTGGNKELRNKLPYWCRKLVTYIDDNGKSDWSSYYRYEVCMQALPDDPRRDESKFVYFYADSWKEVLDQIDDYKKDYSRYGYDY